MKAKILVVDDDRFIRKVLSRHLEKQGFEVTICENAVEAQQIDYFAFDIILLDIMMPKLDGIQFMEGKKEEIRKRLSSGEKVPAVFFVTGYAGELKENWALEMGDIGIKGIVNKPFRLETIDQRIGGIIGEEGDANG